MTNLPDEPAVARTLRTGYPYKPFKWNRNDISVLYTEEFPETVRNRSEDTESEDFRVE